jgi:hypothetical protein
MHVLLDLVRERELAEERRLLDAAARPEPLATIDEEAAPAKRRRGAGASAASHMVFDEDEEVPPEEPELDDAAADSAYVPSGTTFGDYGMDSQTYGYGTDEDSEQTGLDYP